MVKPLLVATTRIFAPLHQASMTNETIEKEMKIIEAVRTIDIVPNTENTFPVSFRTILSET
jgi:hypothetical protein